VDCMTWPHMNHLNWDHLTLPPVLLSPEKIPFRLSLFKYLYRPPA
jgi:hypothetical protein